MFQLLPSARLLNVCVCAVRFRQTFRTSDPDLVIKDRPREPSAVDPRTKHPRIWEDPWRYAFGQPPPPPKYTKVVSI